MHPHAMLVRTRAKAGIAGTTAMLLVASFVGPAADAAPQAPISEAILGSSYLAQVEDVSRLRVALGSDSFVTRVAGAIGTDGSEAPAVPLLPQPTERQLEIVEPLPAELRPSVAGLLAAVETAEEIVGDVPLARLSRLQQRADSYVRKIVQRPDPRIPRRPSPEKILNYYAAVEAAALETPAEPFEVPPFVTDLRKRVDEAGMLVATALDAYLPAIESARSSFTDGKGAVCDTLDAAPALCLGSTGANGHVKNASLLIDAGGNDKYANSAGATFTEATEGLVSVAVAIDLGGNDEYVADPKVATGPPQKVNDVQNPAMRMGRVLAQGAGFAGVGMLLDTAGDDVYRLAGPAPTVELSSFEVQGQGLGAFGGLGLLMDQAGADDYLLRGSSHPLVRVNGQGAGFFSGRGAQIDAGTGDDSYVMEAGDVAQTVDNPAVPAVRNAFAQGAGQAGTGVLSDAGGTDSFVAEVTSDVTPTTNDYTKVEEPSLNVTVQGATEALFGDANGVLLTGVGNSTYSSEVTIRGPAGSSLDAQGVIGGILDDQGGDDVYRVAHRASFERTFVQKDDCLCDGAEAVLDSLATSGGFTPRTQAQGLGRVQFADPKGILRDSAGDDQYRVAQSVTYAFELQDKLRRPKLPPLLRVWVPGGDVYGQGAAMQSFGALVDRGAGTDVYELRNSVNARAGATSQKWKKSKPDVRLFVAPGTTSGQGNVPPGFGGGPHAVVDEGGSGDVFRIEAVASALTYPDPGGSYEFGRALWPMAHDGLVVAGEAPVITMTTSVPACGDPGYSGFGRWQPCDGTSDDPDHHYVAGGAGTGHAPLAEGAAPQLELLPGIPDEITADAHGASRFPVSARLLDPAGKPLAGVALHFDLMTGAEQETPASGETPIIWNSLYQETVTTNKKGVANGQMPLLLLLADGDDLVPDPAQKFNIEVTFDGAPGLYPRHVVKPIVIRPPGPGPAFASRQYGP